MNKTISINLGGYFFHIDEDAYSKLTSYLDAVKRSLSPEGREEVVKDIESRIAELFQENIKNEKQVISIIEVEGMISIMGQPEDYKIDDEPLKKESKSYNTYYTSKKLYKDDNNKTLGGVCAGLGHYIGIDSIWIKIVFILLSFSGGFGIPLYIILWILLPKAISTTQKLEMRGMPINISNIEKKVKEGIDDITTKINDIDTDRIIHNVKNGSQKIGNTIEDVFLTLFKIIGKIIGTFIVIVSSISLIGLLLGTVFMFFSTTVSHVHMPWNEYLRAENYTDFPMWILYIFSFFVTAIPVFIFLILGLKLLVNDLKSIGSYAKYSLLALWLLSVLFFIYFGLRQASEVGFESKVIDKRELVISPNDTLKLNISFNDFYTKSINEKSDFVFTVDENEKEIIYSNNIKIHLMKTNKSKPFVQIEKTSNGSSYNDAKKRANQINYNFEIKNNTITLDNYLITDRANKYRDQEVHIYLYIPKETTLYSFESITDYLTNKNSDIDKYYGKENQYYKLIDGDFKCLDCPKDEAKTTKTVHLKINGKDIITSETKTSTFSTE